MNKPYTCTFFRKVKRELGFDEQFPNHIPSMGSTVGNNIHMLLRESDSKNI